MGNRTIFEMQPSDIFDAGWISTYWQQRNALYGEIVQLNCNVFIMRRITEFPFSLFGNYTNNFWDCTFYSMFECCNMIVNRIVIDSGAEVLTMRAFKNEIFEHLDSDNHREQLRNRLREVKFKKRLAQFQPLFKDERNTRIAHFVRGENCELTSEDLERRRKLVAGLEPTCQLVNDLFDVLCFGHGCLKIVGEYYSATHNPPDMDCRSDIERLLDMIAENHELLHMKERQPEFWPLYKSNLSASDIDELNKYRRKFGLSPV